MQHIPDHSHIALKSRWTPPRPDERDKSGPWMSWCVWNWDPGIYPPHDHFNRDHKNDHMRQWWLTRDPLFSDRPKPWIGITPTKTGNDPRSKEYLKTKLIVIQHHPTPRLLDGNDMQRSQGHWLSQASKLCFLRKDFTTWWPKLCPTWPSQWPWNHGISHGKSTVWLQPG